ncbi:22925_t:CDS:2, partial [Racocetra persica]
DLMSETWNEMIIQLKVLVARDQTYPVSELKFALRELSEYLQKHYKKNCIVLIDEYDSPMECAYNKGYYEIASDFFKVIFSSLLKSNDENIAKAMLVGVLRITKSGFLLELNNIIVYPLHQESQFPLYVDKFGFTPDEVELLLSMYSTLNTYWVDTGSTQILKRCIWKTSTSFKKIVEKLLKEEYIAGIEIQDDLQYLYLDQYQDSAIWMLLYYAGYLTMNSEKHLVIPNNEAGLGRYDVEIIPKSGVGDMVIIFEFKVVHDNESLHDVAHEGLCQIEKKQYRAGLQDEVKRLLEMGIAFEGKKTCVVGHLLHRTEDREWIKSLQ